jgi:hypothetical protein
MDYIDKGSLALTSRAHGSSGTPTWQLLVRGALDPGHVRQALADTIARYPSLATRVQSLDGAPPEAARYRYAHDPQFTVDKMLAVVDLRQARDRLDEIIQEHLDRHTDLFCDAPVTLTLVQLEDATSRLVFRQHHGLADGRAFIELLTDFAQFLVAARAGERPAAEALAPIARRPELEALALPAWRRVAWTLAGLLSLAVSGLRARLVPVALLPQNRSRDYRGQNGTVHWIVPDSMLDGWNAARKRMGVSLNSLLTAGLFVANQRRQRQRDGELGRTLGALVMETRPRTGFRSFANHLATLEVVTDLGRPDDLAQIARTVQAQVERQRRSHRPEKRLLAERLLVLAVPLGDLQRIVFGSKPPGSNFTLSNLLALPFPTLRGDGFVVEEVHVTTPVAPRDGIVTTVIRYNGRLIFNFNYKTTAASRQECEALVHEFQAALRDATGVVTD